jgi:hypothetical protein
MKLDQILSPTTFEDFYSRLCARSCFRLSTNQEALSEIFSWSALNKLLEQHDHYHPKLRLYKEGKLVPPEEYAESISGDRSLRFRIIPFLFYQQLLDGASAILDGIDQMFEPVRAAAQEIESALDTAVNVNAYASFTGQSGFGLHADNHDVLVFQIEGKKTWSVLDEDQNPGWQGVLSRGDTLYVPEGCEHNAAASEGASLHLSFGFRLNTAFDFLEWLVRSMRTEKCFQQPLRNLQECSYQAFLDSLKREVTNKLTSQRLGQYVRWFQGKSFHRVTLALPFAVDGRISKDSAIQYAGGKPPVFTRVAQDVLELDSDGRTWRFHRDSEDLLRLLFCGRPIQVSTAIQSCSGRLESDSIEQLIAQLTARGLFKIYDQ